MVRKYSAVLAQLGDREPSSILEAQAVIESIRAAKGYLEEDFLRHVRSMPPQSCDKVLQMNERLRETEAAFTTSISEQLYSSKYRFLYEVVQNADDSHYRNIFRQGGSAFLRFTITPKTLDIETNEDGFTRANVEAICATGKSSKKASLTEDYTGEKGFGFKSVFSIAEEVRIQSGVWSFRFEHHRGEDGLGMVTPLDTKPEVLPSDVTTRISLRLTSNAKAEYGNLLDAIADMPDTTLFFLRKLENMKIQITHLNAQVEKITIRKAVSNGGQRVRIDRKRKWKGVDQNDASLYHKIRHTVYDMPQDSRRKGRKKVWVDLAFPVDPDTQQPKASEMGQHVFAYLPLQRLPQLQFLIQSDFITSASRESIIDCAWNHAICSGVATAFTKAVEEFATADHPLKHDWLDYLPHMPMEKPWKTLYLSIIDKLKTMAVLQTWEKRQFKAPRQLRLLPESFLFENQPLLQDLEDEIYAAPEYGVIRRHILIDLGVSVLCWPEVLARVQGDLVRRSSSIKNRERNSPWYEAFANLGLDLLKNASSATKNLFQKQALILLSGGKSWTGAPSVSPGGLSEIFFPYTGTIPIPEALGLNLADRIASKNAKVKQFYAALGVKECPKETVIARIRRAHLTSTELPELLSHLTYLFYTYDQPKNLTEWLKVPTDLGIKPAWSRLYFPSDAKYDLDQLLTRDIRVKQKLDCSVLPKSLIENRECKVQIHERTWKMWLQEATNARYHPKLKADNGLFPDTLSADIQNVLKYKPYEFLGTIKAHWLEYQIHASKLKTQLKECKVPCRSGEFEPLHTTYLPTSSVLTRLSELGINDRALNILHVPDGDLDDDLYSQWRFLEDFGARSRPDQDFYESALEELSFMWTGPSVKLMEGLYRSMAQLATIADEKRLRAMFSEDAFIRSFDGWHKIEKCVWSGPEFLRSKALLEACYPDDSYLKSFFTVTLGIKDSTFETVLGELEYCRDLGTGSFTLSTAHDMYTYLDVHIHNDADWMKVREDFEVSRLVFDGEATWHTLKTCFWNSPFPIAGCIDLKTIYPELEDFFTKKMRVRKATPAVLIAEIKKMAQRREPKIEDIRLHLIQIGAMLARDSSDLDIEKSLDDLRMIKFLPKKLADGTMSLVGVEDDFAILDHERYGKALTDHGILLDFDIYDTQILHAMFERLRLTHRYLSVAVIEQSSVDDEGIRVQTLSRQLQTRAYALYCCAAKHKSRKALPNDRSLFDQLAGVNVHTTDAITTDLVLQLEDGSLKVHSDRSLIHHTTSAGKLTIYVPQHPQQRRICYRSRLPRIIASIIGCNLAAVDDISNLLGCSLEELDDVLSERDVTAVTWITKPTIDPSEVPELQQRTLVDLLGGDNIGGDSTDEESLHEDNNFATVDLHEERSASLGTRQMTFRFPAESNRRATTTAHLMDRTQELQYGELLEQIIKIARGIHFGVSRTFENAATFGSRATDEFVYTKKIGAAGELFAFESLSALDMPSFSRDNWRSTIRGQVAVIPGYADLRNWVGQETTDLVYKDHHGLLTQYLRDNCTGGFPLQIPEFHDHAESPIEYYLEVKSTPGPCNTRFYFSNNQYIRMENMALGMIRNQPLKVYVILRVSSLTASDTKMRIYVDPLRFKGTLLDFEADKWFVQTR